MAAPTPAAATAGPARPRLYADLGETVRVACNKEHAIKALYVVWRIKGPAPADEQGEGAANASVLEVARGGDDRGADAPGRAFVVSISDRNGFLQPVKKGRNPLYDVWSEKVPHSFKLLPGARYEGVLVRHPKPEIARDLARWLTNPGDPDLADFAAWVEAVGKPEAKELRLKPVDDQLTLQVEEKPGAYWPPGSKLYDGWNLYLDMPHQECKAVHEQVARLQMHLAALRYPVGPAHHPYRPVKLETEPPHLLSEIDAACVNQFQVDRDAGRAFEVEKSARAHAQHQLVAEDSEIGPGAFAAKAKPVEWACRCCNNRPRSRDAQSPPETESWAYLLGKEVPFPRPVRPRGRLEGLVDGETGDAIGDWLKRGWRKPGRVLLRIPSGVGSPPWDIMWMGQEGAIHMEAWRQLAGQMGVGHDIPSGMLSLRTILDLDRNTAGKANASIHKTGLAVDLFNGSYAAPSKDAPVRIEARWLAKGDTALGELAAAEEGQKAGALDQADAERALAARKLERPSAAPEPRLPPAKDRTDRQEALQKVAAMRSEAQKAKTAAVAGPEAQRGAQVQRWLASVECLQGLLKKQIDLLKPLAEEERRRKDQFRLRWMIYAHSTLDVFQQWTAVQKPLQDAIDGFPAALRARLLPYFPEASRTAGGAWLDAHLRLQAGAPAEKGLEPILDVAQIVAHLGGLAGDGSIVNAYFRESIRPFVFDLHELDGGSSWPQPVLARADSFTPTLPDPENKGAKYPAPKDPDKVRSYVNLTGLGQLCRMMGIGTASGWKLGRCNPIDPRSPATKKDPPGLEAIGKLVAELKGGDYARKPAYAEVKDWVTVGRAGATPVVLAPHQIDTDFLAGWAKAIEVWRKAVAKEKLGAWLTLDAPQVKVSLSDWAKLGAVESQLSGDFGTKPFLLWTVGSASSLNELVPKVGATIPGSDLAALLKGAADRVAKASRESGAKPGTDDELSVVVQPLLDDLSAAAGGVHDKILFQPGDQVVIRTAGENKPREWWHYQSRAAAVGTWGDLMNQIGFGTVIMAAPRAPDPGEAGFTGRGFGYTEKERGNLYVGKTMDADAYAMELMNAPAPIPPGG